MDRKYLWAGAAAAAVVILDQVTKYLIVAHVRMYEIITVIPGFFNVTHVRNRGAAFGMLSNMPELFRSLFFIAITLIAVVVIAVLVKKTHERLQVVAFSLIAGGAVGNVIDRLRFGEVVDFIDWYVRSYHWHTFNVADSAITIGVALLIIDMLRKPRENAPAS
ncbi:MAG: signal peptidase II [Nitrospirae bacterium GWC2_57_13]|jgi:signal peptidase II|nr:MAG: signal peptidase II [Nitrospirae bacterium GWC1_57_7]OGW28141.1 MAG: signal peptidase II [Nitrospirae bacterium GWC2_57_13]OGW46584.1 MAG: signal peptidase II [Nitrospirae bacterium GWD2_57_8]HAS53732.1 signal peptidase II [Nitrospiraceae bacterium]